MSTNFGQRTARERMHDGPRPDGVLLWRFPDDQYTEAVIDGVCSVTLAEYRRRLAGATAEFQRHGVPVVMVNATVAEVLDALARHDLPNTPNGRAAAVAFLFSERT